MSVKKVESVEIKKYKSKKYPYYIKVGSDGYNLGIIIDDSGLTPYYFSPDITEKFLNEYITRYKEGEQVDVVEVSDGDYYLYGNNIYKTTRDYSKEELLLLILNKEDKGRRKFERFKHKFSQPKQERKNNRVNIPEKTRIDVWRRDGGKCTKCGSRENLEYDHIIPVSKGGSNTARNIELLCEKCNREKSDKIM